MDMSFQSELSIYSSGTKGVTLHHSKWYSKTRVFVVLQGNTKVFYELDMKDTVLSQLAHKTVYEFPVIHVAISADPIKFPIVISNPPSTAIPASPALDVKPVEEEPEGRFFLEEDIEEGEFVP